MRLSRRPARVPPPDAYGYLPRDKVVALITGSQGEPRAALARIADDEHPEITLSKGDRVIFSSRAIPGNEKAIGRIVNMLVRQGIEILTDRHDLVHVSGHPRRDELAAMYRWTRPRIAVPAHGEDIHLAEHAAFARAQGVPEVVRARNGTVVRLAPGRAEIVDDVPVGRLYKDGDIIIDSTERAVPERRKLAFAGIVSVAIAIDRRGEVAGEPVIDIMGVPDKDRRGEADRRPHRRHRRPGARRPAEGAPPRRRGGRGCGRPGGPLGGEQRLGQEARLPCAGGRDMRKER